MDIEKLKKVAAEVLEAEGNAGHSSDRSSL